jgi:hypothetical protein
MARTARKTVDVEFMRQRLNLNIQKSTTSEARLAFCSALEDILMEANRYRGFGSCDSSGKMVAYVADVTDTSVRFYY